MGRPEKRSISYQTLFATGQDLPGSTVSGVPMTEELAVKVTTVWACVRPIRNTPVPHTPHTPRVAGCARLVKVAVAFSISCFALHLTQ